MAILENRVKSYSKKSKHKIIKLTSFTIIPTINFITIIGTLVFCLNVNLLSLNNHLVDINGFAYTKLINPTKEFIQASLNFIFNAINFNNLHLENLALKSQNKKLANEIVYSQEIKRENLQLMKAINIIEPANLQNLKAKLIFHSSSDGGYFAVIAGGKEQGITANQVVLTNGYLAGRIVTVGKNYSKVSLVNSYNSRIPVKTNNTGLKAILVGGADKGGYLLHLHGGQKPQEGELIVTSGDGDFYPKDIPVAKVTKIVGGDIVISVFSDLSTTEFVEIVDHNNFDN